MNGILLIAEKPDIIDSFTSMLSSDFDIYSAGSEQEGIEKLKEYYNSIAAVLIELKLARRSSFVFTDLLHEYASLSPVPIIAVSDSISSDADMDCIEHGFFDLITAFTPPPLVHQRIRNAIRAKESLSLGEVEKMLKELPSCIFLKDSEGRYVFSTQYWNHLDTGNDPNWTIRGKTDLDIRKDKENARKAMEADRRILETGEGTDYIIQENQDGILEYLQLIKRPVYDNEGRIKGIIALINNVTDYQLLKLEMEKQAETDAYKIMEQNRALSEALARAEEASAAKSAFLSSMSHEMRTPMNAIIGLDNIALRDPNISDETRDELEKIGSSARHLLSLINDILDMSRIESGRMVLKNEAFSFRDLLDQINIIINGQCEDKGLHYVCNKKEPLDEYFTGDDLRLKQIIINILGNAVKFTDAPGTVTFSVEQSGLDDDSRLMQFTISDTGIGMDEAFIPKLFEPFVQEDATTTNRYGGSGLGMAITKNMIDLMGGSIAVESVKGHGTTFTVCIPLRTADHAETADAADGEAPVSVAGLNVLIAEDMEINAEVLADLLELEGVSTEWAENGRKAVEMFAQSEPGHFDVILMDMRMPVMDGLAATREIRKLDRPDAACIPVIALTANAFEEDVRQCLEAGMDAHMSKPVDIDQLKKVLGRLLSQQ